jgi:pimeloyl-ACP methyl ester carboxylesterase
MTLPEIRRGFPTYRSASGEEPARVAARKVDSRGLGISYDDVGEGPTIVLISGFSQSGGDWWELGYVDRLVALGRRVLVVDPLGHGSSDRPHDPAAYRWPGVALDIVAAMDSAGVMEAILWGFSRGGALAACVAIERPDRAVGLILAAAADLGETPPVALSQPIEALLAGDWATFFATPGGSIYADATRRYHELVNDPRAFGAALAGRRLFPYDIDLRRISARSLAYGGSEDQPELDRRTAKALGVEFHELPGLDHRTGLSDTARVMAVVEPFLGGFPAPGDIRPEEGAR